MQRFKMPHPDPGIWFAGKERKKERKSGDKKKEDGLKSCTVRVIADGHALRLLQQEPSVCCGS